MKMKEKAVKTVEIKEVLPFFVWAMLDPDEEQAKRYGFESLKDACKFWKDNQDDFKPYLGGNQFPNIDNSIDNLMDEEGWK